MKNGLTELVFILDRSGSMQGLERDTIGGFNSMIERQKAQDGEVYVSTVLFDNLSEVIHDRVKLSEIKPMTEREYFTRGSTALLDAVGSAVRHIKTVHKYAREEDVPEKTIFVITTDGMENSSTQYTHAKVKAMIEQQQKEHGWEFLFLGANIDAAESAKSIGIDKNHAADYICDSAGTELNFRALSDAVCAARTAGAIPAAWKNDIDNDVKKRRR